MASLHYPEYRKLWLAALCSQSSAWALIVARGALAKTLTGSDLWTALVTFAAMIPSVVVSPIAGFLADRYDRRTVLAYAYGVNLSHNLLLAVLVVVDVIEPWHLLVLALVNGTSRATQQPVSQALLANTLPQRHLFNGVALYQAIQQGARFVGPLLVMLMLWSGCPWFSDIQDWVFFLCAGLYSVGLWLVLSMRTVSTGVVEAGRGMGVVYRNMAGGLSYMYRNPLILSLVILIVAHCGMTMSFESLFPAISSGKIGLESCVGGFLGGFGYLMMGFGSAALVMALALAGVESERARGRLFLVLGVASGVTPVALALSPNLPLAVLSAAGMGASQAGFMALSHGMLQAIAPDAIRGRLMGVYSWHIQGFMSSFNLFNGTLASLTDLTAPLILGAGGVGFVTMMIFSFGAVHLRRVYAEGMPASTRTA